MAARKKPEPEGAPQEPQTEHGALPEAQEGAKEGSQKFNAAAWAQKIMDSAAADEAKPDPEPEKPKPKAAKKEAKKEAKKKDKPQQEGERLTYGGESIVRATQLAQICGVTARRIHQLVQDGVIHAKTRGKYDVDETIRGYIQYLSNKAYGKGKSDTEMELKAQKIKAEIALKETQTELHRMKMDIAQGNYIGREEIELDYRKFFTVFKRFALSLPPRLVGMMASQIAPAELRKAEHELSEETKKMLQAFVVAGVAEDGQAKKDPD